MSAGSEARLRIHREPIGPRMPLRAKRNSKSMDSGNRRSVESALLGLLTSGRPQREVREGFRTLSISAANALGVGHLQFKNSNWEVFEPQFVERSLPLPTLEAELVSKGDSCMDSRSIQMESLASCPNAIALMVPVFDGEDSREIFFMILRASSDPSNALKVLSSVSKAMSWWLRSESAHEIEWQRNTLASVLELVGAIESSDSSHEAAQEVVNSMSMHLGCSNVVLGLKKRGRIQVRAISGRRKLEASSVLFQDFRQVLCESTLRGDEAIYPTPELATSHLLLAHKQLASATQCEAVYSAPLISSNGEQVGAWAFGGSLETLNNRLNQSFIRMASTYVADSLQLVEKADGSSVSKAWKWLFAKRSWMTRLAIPMAVVGFCFLMALPVNYRVRCSCVTEPVSRRFAVAPFDGSLISGFVEPGDRVSQGQPLAELDGRTVRWELSGVTAERKQSQRKREMQLAEGNVSKAFMAELENEKLASEEKILNFKRKNLLIKSPISGVVLSGSLERAEAAAVKTGQVLFEIAPDERIKVQVEIPAEDVSQVRVGQPISIWIEGREDRPLRSNLLRIHPKSVIRNSRNVFIAEVEFDNDDMSLRPGLKGRVRIDAEKQTLAWSLFHKPVNFLRSKLAIW